MADTRIPKMTRHRATGQAVVRLDGRDHYLGRHRSPAARAGHDELIRRWLAHGRKLPDDPADVRRVAGLAPLVGAG